MSVNTTTNYNGADAGFIYEKIIQESDALQKNLLKVKEEVGADTIYVRLTDVDGVTIDYTDDFVGGSSVDLTEVEIKLTKLTTQLEIGIEKLKSRWGAERLNGRVGEPNATDEFDMIMLEYGKKLSKDFGQSLFYGDLANAGEFTGLLTNLTPIQKTLAVPSDYVQALQDAVDATLPEVRDNDDFIILVSKDVLINYARALELRGYEQDGAYIDTYRIETCKDLKAGTILTYHRDNFMLGCDLTSAHNQITVHDMRPSAVNKMRLRADSKYGAGVIEPNKVVYFTKA